ncbi:MAG: S41 family peptidase [Chthonomonadales bacterium]
MHNNLKRTLMVAPLGGVLIGSFAFGQLVRSRSNPLVTHGIRFTSSEPTGSASLLGHKPEQDDSSPGETFKDVLRYIKSDYVDKIDNDQKLGFGAVKTMLASLEDPKTRFLDPAQKKKLLEELDGSYTGIGAHVTVVKAKKGVIEQRRLSVIAPIPGGPAEKAGIQPGDIITEIDGHWIIAYDPRLDLDQVKATSSDDKEFRAAVKVAVKKLTDGTSLPKALDQLNANKTTDLVLTIEREGVAAPIKATVHPSAGKLSPVEYADTNGVGYLRITQFNAEALNAFRDAIKKSEKKPLIVDLRNNAGGPSYTAVRAGVYGTAMMLIRDLVPSGSVATMVHTGGKTESVDVKGIDKKRELVVLVNRGTSNIAEMVALALKERGGAKLVGSRTFGDPIFQKFVDLNGGAAMTFSAAKMLGSMGTDYSLKGITPDVDIASTGPSATDKVVQRAVAILGKA